MNIFEKELIEVKQFVREMVQLIWFNIWPIIIFIVFYSIFNVLGVKAVLNLWLTIATSVIGYGYIGPDNILSVMTSPIFLALTLVALICFSFFAMFEIGALTHAYSLSRIGKKTSLYGMVAAGIVACEKCIRPRNWLIILFLIFILPLTQFITLTSATYCIKVPEFVVDFLIANDLYRVLYVAACLIFLIIELACIFSFNFYTLSDRTFNQSCIESKKLMKKNYIKVILAIFCTSFIFFVIVVSFSAVISEIAVKFSSDTGIVTNKKLIADFQNICKGFLYGTILPVVNIAAITTLFYQILEERSELNKISSKGLNDEKFSIKRIVWLVLILVFLGGAMVYLNRDVIDIPIDERVIPEVVAHRGDSVNAPENTMPAFKLAAMENNTYIEFDVHETKDGVIIVSHDDDLERVTGKNLFVHDLTYAEIQELDTGKWFSQEYEGTKFSTLDEALKFLKDYDMTIQVEIKPTGYDDHLEEKVVQIIRDNNLVDRCMITCLKLPPLLKIEEFAPDIYTVYSMFVCWGNVSKIPVDAYTIEESNPYDIMVKDIHDAGKKCFVWTANTEDRVQYFIDTNVDGILTDNPVMMRNAIINCDFKMGIFRLIRNYIDIMINGL